MFLEMCNLEAEFLLKVLSLKTPFPPDILLYRQILISNVQFKIHIK
jgi:hypothetical protein